MNYKEEIIEIVEKNGKHKVFSNDLFVCTYSF